MSTRLVLVRHGQTPWNAEGRFQGQADVALNEIGVAQAQAMAPRVAALAPDALVASDLVRAQRTAQEIAQASGLAVTTDPRLREIHVGSWSGELIDDVARSFPQMHDLLARGEDFRRSETGETASEAGDRAMAAMVDAAREHPDQTTVLVGHGLALRVGMLKLLGLWETPAARVVGPLWNCSWSILELRGAWRLGSYNNVAPLD